MEIEWRKIPGWGDYDVSSTGLVRSWKAKKGAPFQMKPYNKLRGKKRGSEQGYLTVGLQRREPDGSWLKKKITVHRLVCTAFHENPENKPHINHKDCDQHNNHKDNLEWCTPLENTRHAHANGRSAAHLEAITRIPTDYEKKFISENYYKIGAERVSKELDIPYSTINKWCHKYNLVQIKDAHTKRVIDVSTNNIYNSPKELADEKGYKLKELRRRLSDERPNNTPYRYIDWYGNIREPKLFEEKPKYIPPRPIKPIAVFDMDWNELKRFQYIGDAALFVDGDTHAINEFLNGKREQHKGHKFKLLDETGKYIEPIPFISKKKPKKIKIKGEVTAAKLVEKYDTNGKLVETFGSIGIAAKSLGANKNQFSRQIRKSKSGFARGYIWKVID